MDFKSILITNDLPPEKGKYLIRTESNFSKSENFFYAFFNGKTFNVSNQIVTHWFNRVEEQPIKQLTIQHTGVVKRIQILGRFLFKKIFRSDT